MAPKTKIKDMDELMQWLADGKTYAWMAAEYRRKYGIEVSATMFSAFRRRMGLPKRLARDASLVPWRVKKCHGLGYPLAMLHYEARRRQGFSLSSLELKRLEGFKAKLQMDGTVIHYEPDSDEGWWLVPRRPGIDNDLIRVPNIG
jgi:hypothetical protein